jgi:hypothetical protein
MSAKNREERREAAVARAVEAPERAEALREREARIEAGQPPSKGDLDASEAAAQRAARHQREAASWASEAHEHAASAHRHAADLADATGRTEDAARHRAAAEENDKGATEDVRLAAEQE